jgi:hypothetical protein
VLVPQESKTSFVLPPASDPLLDPLSLALASDEEKSPLKKSPKRDIVAASRHE